MGFVGSCGGDDMGEVIGCDGGREVAVRGWLSKHGSEPQTMGWIEGSDGIANDSGQGWAVRGGARGGFESESEVSCCTLVRGW